MNDKEIEAKDAADEEKEQRVRQEISAFMAAYAGVAKELSLLSNEARRRILRSLDVICQRPEP